MMEKLRKDSYTLGILMGIIVPVVFFGIIYGIFAIMLHAYPNILVNSPNIVKTLIPKFILIAMIPSIFLLRHYLLNLKFDKTGRGILISTFALSIIFVIVQFTL